MKNNNIGNIIKQARKKKGLTQSELGELMGITAVTVGQWETGKRIPKEETIERISEALEIDLTHSVKSISYIEQTSDILTILYDLACRENIPIELLIKSIISEIEFRLSSMEKQRMYYKDDLESNEEYQTWIKLLCIQEGPTFMQNPALIEYLKTDAQKHKYPITEYVNGTEEELWKKIREYSRIMR